MKHIVQNGQSLWSIAIEYDTKIDSIKELNQLGSDSIYNGQELLIYPAGSMPTPAPTATLTPTATMSPSPSATAMSTAIPTTLPTEATPAVEKISSKIPPQTIFGYGIVLVSVIGLLSMLVNMSLKKIK